MLQFLASEKKNSNNEVSLKPEAQLASYLISSCLAELQYQEANKFLLRPYQKQVLHKFLTICYVCTLVDTCPEETDWYEKNKHTSADEGWPMQGLCTFPSSPLTN